MGRKQVCAIVCHELGHWKHYDNLKHMAFRVANIYFSLFCFSFALKYTDMPKDFGFVNPEGYGKSNFLALLLFFMLFSPVSFFTGLIKIFMTRKLEFGADRFAVEQGHGVSLHEALFLSYKKNQDALITDWLYGAFTYDHPAPIERLEAVEAIIGTTVSE